ncbi:lipopolysaccharide biosynthesis protein [Mucilaginibacter psychrotolerans]|uniref:Lipopolysaccharide biosynthesis protein n=1 Tax=Mucilaginibacter psychrotolerans TaxID=1524096 RepID=A0A4Y8S3J3_9SPHI|nr:lipopolysaccharide biosynthesis protein [Mucilaginibacter psychrotolerans]TFF33281.1 lipopolysaccharide biosynthesis protein [Mucilaginibacter psychrotolerans]
MATTNEPTINCFKEQIEPTAKTDKALIKSGVIWTALQMIVNQSFAFIVKLILIKLLLPSQFGLVGMATVFTGLVQVINDIGVGAALVQRREANLTETHYHTAFWTGVAWSIALYVIIAVGVGPIAASFYNQPYLKFIVPVISIGILFSPVNLVHKAQLTRQMNFKKIAIVDNTSNIIAGCIAIILALSGAGIWALVFNAIATVVIAMPLYYNATKWLPKFQWGKQAFKDIFGFGIYTAGANVFTYCYNNVDYLLIGKLLGASTLGTYTFAFVITDTFRSRIMAVINNVMYPIYGKKQSEPVALKRYYLKVVQINCLLIFPIMLFLVLLGAPFVFYIFGAKWQGAIVPLQILSVSVMFQMIVSGNTALIRGLGKPQLDMKLQILKAAIFVPTLAYATIYYGILGASVAILFNKFLLIVIAQFTFNFLLPVKISSAELLKALYPCLVASAAAIVTYLIGDLLGLHFVFLGLLLFAAYGTVVWFMIGHELKLLLKKAS